MLAASISDLARTLNSFSEDKRLAVLNLMYSDAELPHLRNLIQSPDNLNRLLLCFPPEQRWTLLNRIYPATELSLLHDLIQSYSDLDNLLLTLPPEQSSAFLNYFYEKGDVLHIAKLIGDDIFRFIRIYDCVPEGQHPHGLKYLWPATAELPISLLEDLLHGQPNLSPKQLILLRDHINSTHDFVVLLGQFAKDQRLTMLKHIYPDAYPDAQLPRLYNLFLSDANFARTLPNILLILPPDHRVAFLNYLYPDAALFRLRDLILSTLHLAEILEAIPMEQRLTFLNRLYPDAELPRLRDLLSDFDLAEILQTLPMEQQFTFLNRLYPDAELPRLRDYIQDWFDKAQRVKKLAGILQAIPMEQRLTFLNRLYPDAELPHLRNLIKFADGLQVVLSALPPEQHLDFLNLLYPRNELHQLAAKLQSTPSEKLLDILGQSPIFCILLHDCIHYHTSLATALPERPTLTHILAYITILTASLEKKYSQKFNDPDFNVALYQEVLRPALEYLKRLDLNTGAPFATDTQAMNIGVWREAFTTLINRHVQPFAEILGLGSIMPEDEVGAAVEPRERDAAAAPIESPPGLPPHLVAVYYPRAVAAEPDQERQIPAMQGH